MKFAPILIVSVVVVLSGTAYANALLIAETPLELYYHHELILVGKVISRIHDPDGITIEYNIKVEENVKNPKPYDMISVIGKYGSIPSSPEFDVGDRTLLLLNKDDDKYVISPLSFKAKAGCDSHQLLGMQTFPNEPLARGQPQGEFKIDKDCFGPLEVPTGFWVFSPLKQFKSGIASTNVTCSQDLILIIKSENGFPACVKLGHTSRFFTQGWIPGTLNKITVDWLQDAYQVGEKIDFITYFKGFVTRCDYPHVVIQDSNQKTVWSSNYIVQLCDPAMGDHPVFVSQQYNLTSGLGGPIIINQTGDYVAKISFYDQSMSKNFIIFSVSHP